MRSEWLSSITEGPVLELGLGTGASLAHYPPQVRYLTAVEPQPLLLDRARRRWRQAGINVECHVGPAENLPEEWSGRFGTVTTCFTLCSVRSATEVIHEISRVLRPGGRYVMVEHGQTPEISVRQWQRRLDPLSALLSFGCRLSTDVKALIAHSGFRVKRWQEGYLPGLPKIGGYIYRAVLVKPLDAIPHG